jgi:murein DD-endopeptidase MepM/ murein hydrolase activator NlpD
MRAVGFTEDHRKAAIRGNVLPSNYTLSIGDVYRHTKIGQRTELRFFDREKAYVFWRDGQKAGADKKEASFTKKVYTAAGKVNGSIVASINSKVGDELTAYRFLDAYVLEYNLSKQVQRNADFKITYEKLYDGANFIRYGEVLRTELEIDGRRVVRQFVPFDEGGGIYIGPELRSENRTFYAPVDYIRISSLFQPRRFHPIKKYRRAHEGIDFELNEGAPIFAVQSGRVLRIGRNKGAGRFIVIRHANGYESYYNHMSRHANRLTAGSYVKAGDLVGAIGCTGYCTKPHLHFAIKKNGRFIDPIFLIKGYAYHQRREASRLIAKASR